MCGINIIIDIEKKCASPAIHAMNEATVHRGPDHTGIFIHTQSNSQSYIGVNRLAINETSGAADQPFLSADENYILAFNGEIYNHFDLKTKLIKLGYHFRTASDTEVLLYWLIEHSSSGIKALEGMFSFAFLNRLNDEWIFARDKSGMKPLYYSISDHFFVFSSEIKGILASGLVKKELNKKQIDHYLLYKYANSPETFFTNIQELQAGQILRIDRKQLIHKKWIEEDMTSRNPVGSGNFTESIKELLSESLIKHIQAAVPLGIMLSGGVDSTLLLAMAQKEGFSIPSYTIANISSEKGFGTMDYKYAQLAAKQYHSELNLVEISDQVLNDFGNFIQRQDQPVGDSGAYMTDLVCSEAKGQLKVLLSGAGADEYFGGYNRHMAYWQYLQNHNRFLSIRPFLNFIKPLLITGINHPWRKTFRLYKKFISGIDREPFQTFNNMLTLDMPVLRDHRPYFSATSSEMDKEELLELAFKQDREKYLVHDVLTISDRMSMQHGIEMRMPYLDKPLIAKIEQIPATTLLLNGKKWILKQMLNDLGGQKYTERKKEGFGLPLGNWLRKKKHAYLWELFSERNHLIFDYVDKSIFDTIYQSHLERKEDYSQELWSILVLGHWLRSEFE